MNVGLSLMTAIIAPQVRGSEEEPLEESGN